MSASDRIGRAVDQLVSVVAPVAALRRSAARTALRPVATGYGQHGASRAKKSLLGWMYRGGDADADIVEHVDTLRERSRDLFMGTPLATGALRTLATNVVGPGLRLDAQIDADRLGLSDEQADAWERQTEREFALWANSQACDAARTNNFGQLQALAFLSALMSGDVFAALPMIRRSGSIYDLRVHLLEADRICDPFPLAPGANILAGVELGTYGEPVAYYVARHHPGSIGSLRTRTVVGQAWKRVPAYGAVSGRRNMLHLLTQERPEQRRGVPILAPVIEPLKQLGRYTEAELMAAVVSGMLTVFIESASTSESPLGEGGLEDSERVGGLGPNSVELGNGAVLGLAPGEKVQTVNPGRPNSNFDQFVRSVCVPIGAALEIPYELLLGHFTSSYTAARASFVAFWKAVRTRRSWLASGFCQPVYEEWLAEAVARGRIAAPGFFEDVAVRAAWSGAEWHGPTQGQINEKVEAGAANDRVAYGFSTMARETAELTGQNWDQVARTRRRELAKMPAASPPSGGESPDTEQP